MTDNSPSFSLCYDNQKGDQVSFFSPQRLMIVLLGISLAFGSFSLAQSLCVDTVWGSLFLNLAASFITISLTAALVDFLVAKESSSKAKEAFKLASGNVEMISFTLTLSLVRLYCTDYSLDDTLKDIRKGNYIRHSKALKDLDKIDLRGKETAINISFSEELVQAIKETQSLADEAINLYGFSLPSDVKGKILAYRKWATFAPGIFNIIDYKSNKTLNDEIIKTYIDELYKRHKEILKCFK